jgi:hypothetical protein
VGRPLPVFGRPGKVDAMAGPSVFSSDLSPRMRCEAQFRIPSEATDARRR